MKTTLKLTILLPIAAVFTLGIASTFVYAEDPVKMTFSGTAANSVINLQQPNTSDDEDTFAGTGTLGSFTLRNVRAISDSPTTSSTCSGPDDLYFTETAGGGVFRFKDGSLLYVQLTQGGDCINVVTNEAHCTLSFQITGGTGRFKNASGTLLFTETVVTVLSDALNNPVYFAATGKLTGTVSGVREEQDKESQDEMQ
ncbi:MAG: hypothetical protein ACLPH3_18740 [Terracidiphilus sp.]